MNTTRRIEKLEEEAVARIRQRLRDFWSQFNDAELEQIVLGAPAAMEDFKRLGGEELSALEDTISTPAELAEVARVAAEIEAGHAPSMLAELKAVK
jgi:hypothetical protein